MGKPMRTILKYPDFNKMTMQIYQLICLINTLHLSLLIQHAAVHAIVLKCVVKQLTELYQMQY